VRLLGLEPKTYGLKVRTTVSDTLSEQTTSGDSQNDLAFCLALLERESTDLAAIVRAWPNLPEAIKAGILAMIRAAGDEGRQAMSSPHDAPEPKAVSPS
jgi:hypothetical protein